MWLVIISLTNSTISDRMVVLEMTPYPMDDEFEAEEGCLKVKEFVEKDRKNPFFKFLNDENYDEMKRDAARLSLGEFVTKHGTP